MVWMCKDARSGVEEDVKSILCDPSNLDSALVGLAVVLAKIFNLKSVRFRGFVTRNWIETTAVKEMTGGSRYHAVYMRASAPVRSTSKGEYYVSAYRRFGSLKTE